MANISRSSVSRGVLLAAVLSVAALGCQDRMYEDNRALRAQNIELQNRLDETSRQPIVQAPPPAPLPPAPAVQAAAVTPPRTVEVAPPAPAPDPVPVAPAPTPHPDLGTLEATHDAVAHTTTVNLPSDVFFSSGQAVLIPEAKRSLAKLVSALKKEYSSKQIRIEGHTDSDPIRKSHWKSNQELSEARAVAVRDYLVSKGIDTSRITTDGLGDTKPRSKTDKAKNRRVDLVVLGVN